MAVADKRTVETHCRDTEDKPYAYDFYALKNPGTMCT